MIVYVIKLFILCSGITANEQVLSIIQHIPLGQATEDMRYSLRAKSVECVTFQKRDYITQDLLQVVRFMDDVLSLLQVEADLHATPRPLAISMETTKDAQDAYDKPSTLQVILDHITELDRRVRDLESAFHS